ncbi:MAG: sulfur carrier protein ThiS [Acidimicrobiales bacterium]
MNGEVNELLPGTTVADVVRASSPSKTGIAVARNSAIVPRSEWTSTLVEDGDRIEILTAAAGG